MSCVTFIVGRMVRAGFVYSGRGDVITSTPDEHLRMNLNLVEHDEAAYKLQFALQFHIISTQIIFSRT